MVMDDKTRSMLELQAKANVCDGIIYEPRIWCDLFSMTSSSLVATGSTDVFRNGETHPIRITHLLAAVRSTSIGSPSDDRLLQRVGFRMRDHDDYYGNPEFTPLANLHNVVTAPVDTMAQGVAAWRLERPFLLGKKDALEVKVSLETAIPVDTGEATIAVTFHGVGALSRRPKQITGSIEFSNGDGTALRSIRSDEYRNRGVEPIEIHTVVISASPASEASPPVGTIRNVKLSVRQIGSGTTTRWTVCPTHTTPTNPLIDQAVPAALWGLSVGRCLVHHFEPQETAEYDPEGRANRAGWLLYPNQGFQPELKALVAPSGTLEVYLAMAGYIIVK